MPVSPRDQDDWDVSPAEQLEEAFALLRSLPVPSLAWCVAGPVPFVLGLLFFWSDLTRGGQSALSAAGWSAALAGLYAWLKITQAFFARAVWARLLPEGGLPALTAGGWFRCTGALLAHAAVSLPAQFAAANLIFPFAWVYGFFHHSVALAYTQDLGPRPLARLTRLSARLCHHEPMAHHFSLLLLVVLGSLLWAAVFAAGLLGPYLFKILTGTESEFTRNPLAAALNSLYLSITVSVAWMIVSPYFRVAYVLRTFHVFSRRTGDDLLGRLQAAQRRAAAVAAILLVALALAPPPLAARDSAAAPAEGPASAVRPATDPESRRFAEAIRATLAGRDYQWRLPRTAATAAAPGEHGLLASLKRAMNSVRGVLRDVDRLLTEAGGALRRLLGGSAPPASPSGASGDFSASALRGLLGLLAAIGAGVLIFSAYHLHRRRRRPPLPAAVVAGPRAAPMSLADEETLASALPEDEWLRLARAQWEGGDLRLAVRAVFLATLAALGEQRLIDIARSKSNRDYAVELRVRAAARREVQEIFGRSVGVFERAWYGLHDVAPNWVQELLDNHERLKSRVPVA